MTIHTTAMIDRSLPVLIQAVLDAATAHVPFTEGRDLSDAVEALRQRDGLACNMFRHLEISDGIAETTRFLELLTRDNALLLHTATAHTVILESNDGSGDQWAIEGMDEGWLGVYGRWGDLDPVDLAVRVSVGGTTGHSPQTAAPVILAWIMEATRRCMEQEF